MQKLKVKKILAVCSIASTLLLLGTPAFASFETINEDTGFNSQNDVVVTVSGGFANLNQNAQVIANVGTGTVSSGGNIVEENTMEGGAITGNVELDGNFSNDTNINELNHSGSWLSDPLAENNTTGADSVNNATLTLEESMAASNTNDADVDSEIDVEAVSGNNVVSENTGMGTIDTGDVDGVLSTETTVNTNFLSLMATGGGDMASTAINSTTGADSQNDAVVDVENTIGVDNTNDADVNNDIFAVFSSGGNIIEENTGAVDAVTGDASGETIIVNQVNSNSATIVTDSGSPEVVASNDTTGADSVNGAAAMSTTTVGVSNSNVATINNVVNTTATSGGNVIEENTGAVSLDTGDASNSILVDNGDTANANSTTIELGMGDVLVSASNDTTGADSVNQTDAILTVAVASDNVNELVVANNVDAASYTGGNVIEDNGGGATEVTTGDASADVAVVNEVNTNITNVTLNPSATVEATNSSTGADSVNGSAAIVDSTIAVSNTNNADIVNNIDVVSSSGGNEVTENTGGATVDTGSASLTFGAENNGNTNITNIGD